MRNAFVKGRRLGALTALLGLLGGLLVQVGLAPTPASAARVVANPGAFSVTADGGGVKIGGEIFEFEGADADDVSFNGTIASDGTITVPASGISFPTQTVSASGISATVRINPVGADGSLNPTTGLLQLRVRFWIKIDGIPLSGGCRIGSAGSPIDINVAATNEQAPNLVAAGLPAPRPYNSANGDFVIADNDFSVPGTSDCGIAGGQVNDAVGIPSGAGNNELLIDGVTATAFTPAASAFTVSPNPVVVNQPATMSAAGTTTTGLTRFEFDPEGDGTFLNNGTNPVRSHTYPAAGTYAARMRAVYSDGNHVERTVTVQVAANTPPVAVDQPNVTTPEDTTKAITLTGSDANGDDLDFTVTGLPAHGAVSGTAPNITYTPHADFHGTDSIGFTVADGNGGSDTATVTVTVTPVNDAPVAHDAPLTVVEDVARPLTLTAGDVDGDSLTYAIATPPTKGTVSCSPVGGPNCTYTPDPDATGADSFEFTASDATESDTGTIAVTITGVNDAPTATDQALTTAEDTALEVTLEGVDPDGSPVVATVTGFPAHGALTGTAPDVVYTPAPDFHGTDAFTFSVSDGAGGVDAGTISIAVTPENDGPVANDASVATAEETPVDLTLSGSDIDGDALSFAVDAPPTQGSVLCDTAGACTYTPEPGAVGADSFTFTVDDGAGGSDTGTVTVTVTALHNEAPVFTTPASLVVIEDVPRTFTLAATDADGDALTFSVTASPTTGQLTCDPAGGCTYTPAPNHHGPVAAEVAAHDGRGGTTTQEITLAVVPVNDAPTAVDQAASTDQDTAVDVDLVASDPDGDTLTWIVKVAPGHGAASIEGSTLTYTPATGFTGVDTLEVEATDLGGARSRATVEITVSDVAEPPSAGSIAVTIPEDGTATFTLPATDPEGGPLAVSTGAGSLGQLACTGLDCTYTAEPDVSGIDTVLFTVVDDDGLSATGSVVVTILPGPDDPVALDQTVVTTPGATLPITLGASDPDGGPLTFELDSTPSFGSVTGTPPALAYTSGPGDAGTATFTFTVTDDSGRADSGTVTVVVQPGPQAPTAQPLSLTTPEDTPVAVALAGADAEGPVTYTISDDPEHGTLAGEAPLLTYTPDADRSGPDGFSYTVTDSDGNEATAAVTIDVLPVDDRPVASDASATTTRTTPVAIPLVATDVEGDALTYSISGGPHHGTVEVDGTTATYTPLGLYQGSDAFTFRATSANGQFGTGTVVVQVEAGGPVATSLTTGPGATATKSWFLALNWTYSDLNARLTAPDARDTPVAGQVIRFKVGSAVICSATTDADGWASCGGTGPLLAPRGGYYVASYAGNTAYAPTTKSGAFS